MADEKTKKELKKVSPQSLVTEEHVKAALAADKGKEAVLNSWIIEDFTKKGDNYACVVSSVKINFSLNGQNSEVAHVVKLNPCRHFEDYEEFWHMLFVKEFKFYMTLIPELNSVLESAGRQHLRVPRCFHGSLEGSCELIFLEDLRARNFKMFDRKKGLDLAHLRLILQELGKLHAASILLTEKYKQSSSHDNIIHKHGYLKKGWLNYKDNDGDCENVISLFQQYLSNSVAMLEKVGGYDKAITWVEGLKPQVKDILGENMLSSRCNVICHGDCWNNNVLFRYNDAGDPVEVMLLDLQICSFASPATDLNYLLYTSVTGPVRKANLETFLSFYYATFKDTVEAGDMETPFTEEDIRQEFREKNTIGALFAMMIMPLVLMESDDVPDMSKDDDIDELIDEFKTKTLDMMDTNPLLKSRFLSMFDEFIEIGLIN